MVRCRPPPSLVTLPAMGYRQLLGGIGSAGLRCETVERYRVPTSEDPMGLE